MTTKRAKNTTGTRKTRPVGGGTVPAGFYWNTAEWEIVTLSGKGGVLPGDSGARYVKIPVVAMLGLAPMMGALYVMFLPFIGFAMLAEFAGKKVGALAKRSAEDVAGTLVPEMRPGEAYLTGKKDEKKGNAKGDEKGDAEVSKLEAEIAAKRKGKN